MDLFNSILAIIGVVGVGAFAWLRAKLAKEADRADAAEAELMKTKKVIDNVAKRKEIEQANTTDTRSAVDRLRKDWSRD